MACPHCNSTHTRPRQRTTKLGYKTFFCADCRRLFNERTGTVFNDCHLPSDIIYLVVLWRLRYKLSLRDIPEMPAPEPQALCVSRARLSLHTRSRP